MNSTDLFLYQGRTIAEWLPSIVTRIVERFDPLRIVLFGSLARGEADRDSDIDLLVVLPRVEDKRAMAIAIRCALADMPPPIDVIPTDPEELAQRSDLVGSILRPAITEGQVIYKRTLRAV